MIRALAAALIVAAMGSPAVSQTLACHPRAEVGKRLADTYGEALTARLLSSNQVALFEVFTAPGSWTLVITDSAGSTCIIGAGEAWIITGIPQGEPG